MKGRELSARALYTPCPITLSEPEDLDIISMLDRLRFAWVVSTLVAMCACSSERTFTLYRNSVTDERMRIHVATFDAVESADYNYENCKQAQALFQAQPDVNVKFWCEKGAFKK